MSIREGRFRQNGGDIIQQLNPLVYWKCNEVTGTTINDSSVNGNNGTISGGFTLNQPGPLGNGHPGILGDGVSGIITGPSITISINCTLLFFAKLVSTPGSNARTWGTHGANTAKLQFQPAGFNWPIFVGAASAGYNGPNFTVSNGFFYFSAGKCDGVNVTAYLQSMKSAGAPTASAPSASAILALAGAGTFINAVMLAAAVFNTTLTDIQIFEIYRLMRGTMMCKSA